MMKKSIITLAALALLAWGCSSDNDESTTPAPTPAPPTPQETTVIEPGTDERPQWVAPSSDDFEQNMNVYLELQDELLPYISENDIICAKIDGEVRGVAVPQLDEGDWLIPLIVFSNGAAPIQLSYYCHQLHRIFNTDWTTFDASVPPTGEDGIHQPLFIK